MLRYYSLGLMLVCVLATAVGADDKRERPSRYGTVKLQPMLQVGLVRVYVDDHFVGNAGPVFPKLNLKRGDHNIRVEADGFEPIEQTLHVLGNGSVQYLVFELKPEAPPEAAPDMKVEDAASHANAEPNAGATQPDVEAAPTMTKYQNLGGRSNILEYACGEDYIKIRFADSDTIYVYDASAPGAEKVAEMKRLAQSGSGLSAYIYRKVKKNYSRKE
jgi:hypothetical protein